MSGNDKRSIVQEWLDRAEDDERSAVAILNHKEGAASTVCFLAQQLAEKSLKAFLQFYGVLPPKVHDLLQLETLLSVQDTEIGLVHENLLVLNRYYIESRYPGDFPEFSWEEAKEALNAARAVRHHCMKKIFAH